MLTVITMWIYPSCSRQLCCLALLWQGLHASALFSGCLTLLFASTCWMYTRPLELEFVTINRIAWVSFLFLFCLTESETTDSVPSDEENAEVSAFWIFSSLDQGLKIHVLRYFSPFSICNYVYQWNIHGNSWGRKADHKGSGDTDIWMIVTELISLQIHFSSSVQTTRLICIIRCSAEPSTVPASMLIWCIDVAG